MAAPGFVRTTGWTRPLHPLQVLAWALELFFGIGYFGVVAPLVGQPWRAAAFVVPAVLHATHAAMMLACTSLDPADVHVRARDYRNAERPVTIDRRVRRNVIENK